MGTEQNKSKGQAMFAVAVVAGVVLAGAALKFFFDAYSMSVANAAPVEMNMSTLQAYKTSTDQLLVAAQYADDRALGGESGQTKRSEKLGLARVDIEDAKKSVVKAINEQAWAPIQLTAEQRAALAQLEMGGITPEMILAAKAEPKSVEQGMGIFKANCASCHGAKANGHDDNGNQLIGPNLTDAYWIHGGGPVGVYKTVANGVAAKGMPAWVGILGEEKSKLVSAYVLSVAGTNVAGRAPQGVDADGNPAPAAPSDG